MQKLLNYTSDEILPMLANLSSDNIATLQERLYLLREWCGQHAAEQEFAIERILEAVEGLEALVNEHKTTLADLREIRKVRKLSLGSNIINQLAEIASGEESFRDFLMTSIATFISWKADSKWVKMAQRDCAILANDHMIRVRGLIWQLISRWCLTQKDVELSKVATLGDEFSKWLPQVFNDDLPPALHVVFVAQIYVLIIYIYLARMIAEIT